jgi:Ca2+-binding EF-hand superfamily protein
MPRVALILLASVASLCGSAAAAKSSVYISLMGEPFRINAACEDTFDQWFGLADRDGDGGISRVELRGDAEAFFTALDTNADKVIDADEMAAYERDAPGRTRAAGGIAAPASSSRPTPKSSAPVEEGQVAIVTSNAPSATRVHPGQSPKVNAANVPQPVAMADLNLDRRVTLEEFLKTAGKRFVNYDVDQDGRLTRKELR